MKKHIKLIYSILLIFVVIAIPKNSFAVFNGAGTYSVLQKNTDRYLDAWENGDFDAVTRTAQWNDSQKWIFTKVGSNTYTIKQKNTNRFLDTQSGTRNVITTSYPTAMYSNLWYIKIANYGGYTIKNVYRNLYLDAYESGSYSAVLREKQNNMSQEWMLTEPWW